MPKLLCESFISHAWRFPKRKISQKRKKRKKKRGIKSQFEKLFNPEGQQNYISI